jgi:osmoprotectant transport system ATP-binding protein
VLKLTSVSKSFGDTIVLHPTTLIVQPCQTTVLIGPSGCGKTTLLRLMVGMIQPDTGSVRFDGTEVSTANVLELRRRMGFVLQDGGLFPHLSARDNVALLTRFLKWDAKRSRARIDELARLVRLPDGAIDRFPLQLSGGQRQRVSLMRALMLDPTLVLLDEPMGALDPLVRFDLQNDLKRIFKTLNKTMVLVTHDMSEAEFFSDLVILLNNGRIVQQGTLENLRAQPADDFVRQFLTAQRVPWQSEIRREA